jgi:hypothetical protein
MQQLTEASGSEIHFTNGYDPDPRGRRLFTFPRPETLGRVVWAAETDPERPTSRAKVKHLLQQEQLGVDFTPTERWWLDRMVEVIAVSAGIDPDDLDNAPFTERGGIDGAIRDLGTGTVSLIDQLNTELAS